MSIKTKQRAIVMLTSTIALMPAPAELLSRTRASLEPFEQHAVGLLHQLDQLEVASAA